MLADYLDPEVFAVARFLVNTGVLTLCGWIGWRIARDLIES